jgi:hypothetical protein
MQDNTQADALHSKYAYAILQTGVKGGSLVNDMGETFSVTEKMILEAVNQVHQACDAVKER